MVSVFVHTGYEGNNPCKKYMQCLLPLYPHKPQRKAYLFVILMAQKSLKIIAPLSSPTKIRIYRDSSCIKISLTTSNFP